MTVLGSKTLYELLEVVGMEACPDVKEQALGKEGGRDMMYQKVPEPLGGSLAPFILGWWCS